MPRSLLSLSLISLLDADNPSSVIIDAMMVSEACSALHDGGGHLPEPWLPASSVAMSPYVPEDLVPQVQSVLQGPFRNLIFRELQRTHLDVKLDVNNLLSRDEDGNDRGVFQRSSLHAGKQ